MKIRNFKLLDIPYIVKIFYNEWDLGKGNSNTYMYSLLYLLEILKEKEKLYIGELNGKIIGVSGYGKINNINIIWKIFQFILMLYLYIIYKRPIFQMYNELNTYKSYVTDSDYELSILIVDRGFHKHGYGKQLLNVATSEIPSGNNLIIAAYDEPARDFYRHLYSDSTMIVVPVFDTYLNENYDISLITVQL